MRTAPAYDSFMPSDCWVRPRFTVVGAGRELQKLRVRMHDDAAARHAKGASTLAKQRPRDAVRDRQRRPNHRRTSGWHSLLSIDHR